MERAEGETTERRTHGQRGLAVSLSLPFSPSPMRAAPAIE